jgi:hypothetical protein
MTYDHVSAAPGSPNVPRTETEPPAVIDVLPAALRVTWRGATLSTATVVDAGGLILLPWSVTVALPE